jgi:prepilin-type processing-associated H-X9-DG protein
VTATAGESGRLQIKLDRGEACAVGHLTFFLSLFAGEDTIQTLFSACRYLWQESYSFPFLILSETVEGYVNLLFLDGH